MHLIIRVEALKRNSENIYYGCHNEDNKSIESFNNLDSRTTYNKGNIVSYGIKSRSIDFGSNSVVLVNKFDNIEFDITESIFGMNSLDSGLRTYDSNEFVSKSIT